MAYWFLVLAVILEFIPFPMFCATEQDLRVDRSNDCSFLRIHKIIKVNNPININYNSIYVINYLIPVGSI